MRSSAGDQPERTTILIMNYMTLINSKNLLTSVAALSLLGLAGCATTSHDGQSDHAAACSKAKSAENDASCGGGTDLGPPVVDITKKTPAPGVAKPTPAAQ